MLKMKSKDFKGNSIPKAEIKQTEGDVVEDEGSKDFKGNSFPTVNMKQIGGDVGEDEE